MHNAAYRALHLDAIYTAHDIPPEALAEAMMRFRQRGVGQLAVSIPHKKAMLKLADEVEPVARAIGAVNTVTRVGDRYVGTNTDWIGAVRALERAGPIEGQRAVVLGAGGTARAVVYGLREKGCEVFVLNRTLERAQAVVRDLGASGAGALTDLGDLAPAIVVNTTSVGMNQRVSPVRADQLPMRGVVLDAVYFPERTQLRIDAEARGARSVGGKWMLVYQAVEQLRRFSAQLKNGPSADDLDAVIDVMAEAFDRSFD